jgi:pimeloyl-ACP methyl ester carboxylesterase
MSLLVGHDVGSWVGYPYAHRYPEQQRGLGLVDGNIPGVNLRPTITLGSDSWRNWHFLFNPVLALGGEVGSAPDLYDSMKSLATDVRGGVIAQSGHYIVRRV